MKDTPDGFLSYYLPFRKRKTIQFFDSPGRPYRSVPCVFVYSLFSRREAENHPVKEFLTDSACACRPPFQKSDYRQFVKIFAILKKRLAILKGPCYTDRCC